jgi:hypothetical protein
MRAFEQELSWWAQEKVSIKVDLSDYAAEVARLTEAGRKWQPPSEEAHLQQLSNELSRMIARIISQPLMEALKEAGLRETSLMDRNIEGGFPRSPEYGSDATLPCWQVENIDGLWLAGFIGTSHRVQPEVILTEKKFTALIAKITKTGQENYINMSRDISLSPGLLGVEPLLDEAWSLIAERLPEIVADFLESCKEFLATGGE